MPAKTKTQNLTAQAYEKLRSDILACRLRPGQKIKISDQVSALGYSLGAVRESLSRLASEGLVVAEPNKGYRVASITQSELEDLTRTRVLIECQCLENAIQNGDLKWETRIVSTEFELSRITVQDPADPARVSAAWSESHRRFHEALVAACDSPWLLKLRELLFAQSERYRSVSVPLDTHKRDVLAEHKAIAQAAIARDTQAAVQAMRDHLQQTTRILVEANVMEDEAKSGSAG
nr:GntR family transcriptional regulator [Amylibacter sp.]